MKKLLMLLCAAATMLAFGSSAFADTGNHNDWTKTCRGDRTQMSMCQKSGSSVANAPGIATQRNCRKVCRGTNQECDRICATTHTSPAARAPRETLPDDLVKMAEGGPFGCLDDGKSSPGMGKHLLSTQCTDYRSQKTGVAYRVRFVNGTPSDAWRLEDGRLIHVRMSSTAFAKGGTTTTAPTSVATTNPCAGIRSHRRFNECVEKLGLPTSTFGGIIGR